MSSPETWIFWFFNPGKLFPKRTAHIFLKEVVYYKVYLVKIGLIFPGSISRKIKHSLIFFSNLKLKISQAVLLEGDETKVDKFERLFDKWKRRQDYRRKIDRQTRKNRITDPTTSSRSKPSLKIRTANAIFWISPGIFRN